MLGAVKDIFQSERGLMAIVVLVLTAALTALGRIELTSDQWTTFATTVLGIYTGGKTIQGVADAYQAAKTQGPAPVVAGGGSNVVQPVTVVEASPPPAPPPSPMRGA